jgi:hypothetical protein
MAIENDEAVRQSAGSFYGKYMGTLKRSGVRVDLFVENDGMVGHVSDLSLPPNSLDELKQFADRHGYRDRLRFVFSYPRVAS